MPQLAMVLPVVLFDLYFWFFWPGAWQSSHGASLVSAMTVLAGFILVTGGMFHAAPAIYWEVSPELRELVRLTGIGPLELLCCKFVARWLTIVSSVLLLAPIVFFAVTLGGVTTAQLFSGAAVLVMLAALMVSIGLVAGVSATDSQNSPSVASTATFLLLLVYHLVFWLSGSLIYWTYQLGFSGGRLTPLTSWWRVAFDTAVESAPATVFFKACNYPLAFSPLAPSYWIHFLIALAGIRMASIVMVNRFRSLRVRVEADEESSGAARQQGRGVTRPRLVSSPFFWKDAYILSGGTRSRAVWTASYIVLGLAYLVGAAQMSSDFALGLAMISQAVFAVIFAVRVDALLGAEFRQQTWQCLMLLPIDRRQLLWGKVQAVAWEQRAALFPIGIAVLMSLSRWGGVVLMSGGIAALSAVLMCQVSAVYCLAPKSWFAGGVQAGSILVLVVVSVVMWISLPQWISFVLTMLLMSTLAAAFQTYIHEKLRTWTE